MTSLANIIEQIKSEITVDANGKGKASIRATARLAGVSDSTLSQSLKTGASLEPSKLAERLTSKGFEGALLAEYSAAGVPDLAIAAICEYYAFDAGRYCNEQAKLVYRAFASIGIRAWMQEVSGYRKTSQPRQLTSVEKIDKVSELKSCLEFFNMQPDNPRFMQELQDLVGDTLGLGQKRLPGQAITYLGVAERAEQLGYPVGLVTNNRCQLGKYVKACGLPSVKEQRLCNGTMRDINLYELTGELDIAIKEFMDAKVLSA